jgi:hypothetical protein
VKKEISVAIALGIVCIILAISLVGAVVHYTSMMSDKDSTITNLQNQVNDLTNIANLEKSANWAYNQTVSIPPNGYISWNFSANYAGFISVSVLPVSGWSWVTYTYVRVTYTNYHAINYDNQLSSLTVAHFPILPSSNIQIRLVNTNSQNETTERATITYYY